MRNIFTVSAELDPLAEFFKVDSLAWGLTVFINTLSVTNVFEGFGQV